MGTHSNKARHHAWMVKQKRVTDHRDGWGYLTLHVSKNGRAVQDRTVLAVARMLFPTVQWDEPSNSSIRSMIPVPADLKATKEKTA